jgi:hypothetical protein
MTITPADLTPAELAAMAGLPEPDDAFDGLNGLDKLCTLLGVETMPEILLAVAVIIQRCDTLTAAAQASIAAADLHVSYDPLSWLREQLDHLGLLPKPGTRPTDYMPVAPEATTWGAR